MSLITCELGLVGYDKCLTRIGSRVRFSELVSQSAISSVVRIHRCQRRGPSSILGWRIDYFCVTLMIKMHDWRSWQRVGLIILRSWVRPPHCAANVFQHYWRSRQRFGLMYRRSRVQIPDSAAAFVLTEKTILN